MERVANARPEANPSSRELRRTALRALVESKGFGQVVMAVIVINAITLGLETSERAVAAAGPLLAAIDRAAARAGGRDRGRSPGGRSLVQSCLVVSP